MNGPVANSCTQSENTKPQNVSEKHDLL